MALQSPGGPPHRPGHPGQFDSEVPEQSRCALLGPAPSHHDCACSDCRSTRTPRPIVEDTATLRRYTPLLDAGLALFRASISAVRLPCSLSASNERRPRVAWMMPALSARYCTWPALALRTAVATSGVTVPTFGLGIRPRGPRIWPSVPTTRIASGAAITTSNGMSPAFTRAARSSMPTMSAPAALASSALAPWANTATRLVLPVPLGITTAPRTTWSDFFGSMPSCTATSMDSSNLAVAASLTRVRASLKAYSFVLSTLPCRAFCFLVSFVMSDALHRDAHRTGRTGQRADGGVDARGVHVLELGLGDLFELGPGDLADLVAVRRGRTLLQLHGLLDQDRRGRGLDDEGEALVRVRRDDDGQRQAGFHALGLRVERLAELHNVQAALAQCRADRRRRIGFACRNLQLDKTDDFLRHGFTPCG